jgi:hypothetical protein
VSRASLFKQSDLNRIAKAAKLSGTCAEIDVSAGKISFSPVAASPAAPAALVRHGETPQEVLDEIVSKLGNG